MRDEALRVAVFPAFHSTMSEWITDRQPTQADEDKYREVIDFEARNA